MFFVACTEFRGEKIKKTQPYRCARCLCGECADIFFIEICRAIEKNGNK